MIFVSVFSRFFFFDALEEFRFILGQVPRYGVGEI